MYKNKIRASLIHFSMSLIFLSFIFFICIYFWYPKPFFKISGLDKIILLIIIIDLILGPLLTFIIFKKGKPSLKIDLTTIFAIQIAALLYGVSTIYQAHPLYIAYAVDRFSPIDASEVQPAKARYAELKLSKLSSPVIVYVKKPSDPSELSRVTLETLSGKADLDARPEYYEPLDQNIIKIFDNSIKIDFLLKKQIYKNKIDNFLKNHGGTINDYAFLPLIGRDQDVIWAWHLKTKKPIDIIEINPFDLS
jgi:hypothetical protein